MNLCNNKKQKKSTKKMENIKKKGRTPLVLKEEIDLARYKEIE